MVLRIVRDELPESDMTFVISKTSVRREDNDAMLFFLLQRIDRSPAEILLTDNTQERTRTFCGSYNGRKEAFAG